MRKITHLEIAIFSYLLTFGFSNSLAARVFHGFAITINSPGAIPSNSPSKGGFKLEFNNENTFFLKIGDTNVDFNDNNTNILKSSTISITENKVNISCSDETNGSIDIAITGGTGIYTYYWTGPSGYISVLEDITNLNEGDYTVTVRDAGIVAGTKDYTIFKPDALDGIVTQNEITCNGTDDGSITISGVTGGWGTYEYSKDNGSTWQNSNIFLNVSPGNYDVLIRDAEFPSCSKVLSASVGFNQPPALNGTTNKTDVSCNGIDDGSITISSPTGGYGTYEYSINNGSTWQNSGAFTNLAPATYQVLMRDAANTNCTEILNSGLILTQTSILNATYTQTSITCFGANDGKIVFNNPSGGYGTYQYSINNGGSWKNSGVFNNLSNGNYHLLIRDKAKTNCVIEIENNLILAQPEVLYAEVTSTNISCNSVADGTIIISSATGGYGTYEYSINNGGSWQTSGLFSDLAPTNYQVLIRDAANVNCTKNLDSSLNLTQPSALIASYTSTPITCFGANDGKIVFNSPSGGHGTYQYSINNGASWENSGVYNNLGNNTYHLLIRDKDKINCAVEIESNLILTQPAVLNADVASTNISCNSAADGIITFSNPSGGSGSYSYSITNGSIWQSSNTFANLPPNTYSVLIRDANAIECEISLTTIEITQPFELNADVDFNHVSCNGANDGNIIITNATGGYGNYEYSINGSTWQNNGVFENLTNNTYNVQIRDLDYPACSKVLNSALNITQPEILTSLLASKIDVLCTGNATGEATVSANGGTAPYTYIWSSLGSGATRTNLVAGIYTMTATDANGCEAEPLTVSISEPVAFLEIKNITTTAGCSGQNNATATIEAEGGMGAYTYLWDNTQTGITATNLAHGSHTVEVTDANGCTKQETFSVAAPAPLVITEVSTTETTFYGSASGTATANVSGGTPNFTFIWSNGQTGQIASNLVAGNYSVIVTDTNGCTATQNVTIYDTIEAEISSSAICKNKMDVIRTSYFEAINTRGGNGIYSYSWNFGTNAINPNRTGAGKHMVTYTQTGQQTITLIITDGSQTVSKTFTSFVVTCYSQCVANDLKVGDFYIGDQTGNRLSLTNCQVDPNPVGASIWVEFLGNSDRYALYHEYLFVVNHPDGSKTVYENSFCSTDLFTPIPTLVKFTDIVFSCGDSVSLEKIYITVNQNLGEPCNAGASPKCFSISVAANVTTPFYAVAIANELLCNGSNDGTIAITATGGKTPYTYNLDGGTYQTSNTFNSLTAKSYVLSVKDADNKIFPLISEVTEPTNPIIVTISSQTDISCYKGSDGSITVTASGGTPKTSGNPYTYVWNNGQTTATASNLKAGDHDVMVVDANGCQVELTLNLIDPSEILADAGPDQIVNCGNSSTFLQAVYTNTSGELGTWTVVNGPDSGTITDASLPTSLFTGIVGTYTLRWTVPCGETDDVQITLSNCSTIDFDGVNDYIDFGDNFDPTGNFALEAWVKQDATAGSGIKTIISKRDISNPIDGFELILDNNTPSFKWNNSTITSTDPIGSDRWYHIAVVQNDLTSLYVDGILVTTGAVSVPVSNTHKFQLGSIFNSTSPALPSNYFHGWIEEVRIWNTALTEEQLHFMMNQRIVNNSGNVRGAELPLDVPDGLSWNSLDGYYQMEKVVDGFTISETASGIEGKLINITTAQERTAPLPYISKKAGTWFTDATWLRPNVWDPPNSAGINGDLINWNIARISHNINSGGKDIALLGLLSESNKLTMANPNDGLNENNSGQALTITHYLKLDGDIDLVGESQLIQTEGSILDDNSLGTVERDQQGTASSYNYNYWSSPVALQGLPQNSDYTISGIMMDGTNAASPINLNFGNGVTYADGAFSNPRKVSTYWLYKFHGEEDEYGEWKHIGSTGILKAGEGYTMKGTSGNAAITTVQNYTFKGKPNNGTITLNIETEQNLLVGNPYPSAMNGHQFILDNIKESGGNNSVNVFNGALYFWDHFGGKTHTLREYIGGYATYNLLGGLPAIATDDRINSTGDLGSKTPGRYIPVGQGFFVNTAVIDSTVIISGGDVLFKNGQRTFIREMDAISVFHGQEKNIETTNKEADVTEKIRISFKSPLGYNRQLLVGANPNASNGFNLGYDAPMNEFNKEDMFWIIGSNEFVIQGVGNFDPDQVLPLGIVVDKEGAITIKIDELENISDDKRIYLNDKLNNVIHDIKKSEYNSTSQPGYFLDRFEIIFYDSKDETQSEASENTTTDNDETSANTNNTDSNTEKPKKDNNLGNEVIIDPILDTNEMTLRYAHVTKEIQILNPLELLINDLRIYKVNGELLKSFGEIENAKEARISIKNYSSGVYTVKCYMENKIISKNIIIKN